MTDFKSAFEDGLKAAEKAQIARSEIDAVFDELNRQLSEVSKGHIQIQRVQLPKKTMGIVIPTFFYADMYWAIVANNPAVANSEVELATWGQSATGYPCKMEWADHEAYYEDKQALESGLANLLQDPVVGGKLNTLMRTGASGGHDKAR